MALKTGWVKVQPDNLLLFYPVRKCSFEENDGLITVNYVNPEPSFLDKYIFKKLAKKPAKIDLDEIGSFLWNYFDGEHTVNDLIKLGEERFGEEIAPAEDRVAKFVMQMAETRLIKLYQKKEHTD